MAGFAVTPAGWKLHGLWHGGSLVSRACVQGTDRATYTLTMEAVPTPTGAISN